jgi:hypothetical protein
MIPRGVLLLSTSTLATEWRRYGGKANGHTITRSRAGRFISSVTMLPTESEDVSNQRHDAAPRRRVGRQRKAEQRRSEWLWMRLRFHLVICRFCRGFDRDLHLFEAAVRIHSQKIDSDTVAAPATLQPEAQERILRAMESEGR